jgi:hypothetical protein
MQKSTDASAALNAAPRAPVARPFCAAGEAADRAARLLLFAGGVASVARSFFQGLH